MLEQLDTAIGFATVMLLLSLLVTTIVQMVLAVFNLRGKFLLEGTEQLLAQLYPDLKNQASTIAKKVLTHPAIGERTQGWKVFFRKNPGETRANAKTGLAVAIRPEELILVLKDLAENDKDLEAIQAALKAPFTETPRQSSAEMIAKAEELLKKMENRFPEETKDLRGAVESLLGTTQSIAVRVDAWFDTVMDRTSEVFKYYTRWITIVVAVLLALLLRVDSLSILEQISEDEDLRARLVQMSVTAQEEAQNVIALEGVPLATRAVRELAEDKTQPEVMKVVSGLCPQAKTNPRCGGLKTHPEGRNWLAANLANLTPDPQDPQKKQQQKVLEAYDRKFTAVTQTHLKNLGLSFQRLQDHLGETQLEIIPDPLLPWRFNGGRNFLGVVMTAFFLSLGAPFWYNALRKLSDLRPIVARRVDGEPLKGAPKQES